jgi:hypothetical protein
VPLLNQKPSAGPLYTAVPKRHILAYALAVHFFLGSILVLDALNLTFFFYYPRPIQIVVISPQIDLTAWMASVLCISVVATTTLPRKSERKIVQAGVALLSAVLSLALLVTTYQGYPSAMSVYLLFLTTSLEFALLISFHDPIFDQASTSLIPLVLVYLLAFFVVVEASAAIHYSLQAFNQTTEIGKWDAEIELQLSYASYGLLPWLYVAFLFSWAWVPIVHRALPKITLFERQAERIVSSYAENHPSLIDRLLGVLDPKVFLALALAVFIGYYPYFQNPPWLVGTDAYWRYYDPLVQINANGTFGAFAQALSERHPVPLMLLYMAHLLLNMTLFDVVRFAQLLLVVLVAVSIWWFLDHRRRFDFGLTVFLLSVLSITTTVGFYSSIIANWMALVVWVLFFAYLSFRGDGELGLFDFVMLFFLSTVILFIHPWTWGVFATAVVVAAILALVQEKRRQFRTAGLVLAVIVADVVLAFITISYLSTIQGWRVLEALGDYTFVINNPWSVFWFWDALTWLTRIWSPFFSPLYFVVSIVGVFSLNSSTMRPWCQRLIFAWLFVSAIGSILVAPVGFNVADPASSETQLWRLLYITPVSVLAPLGITWISRLSGREDRTLEEQLHGDWNSSFSGIWLGLLTLVGLGLAWASVWERLVLFLFLMPTVTGILLVRTHISECKLLSALMLAMFVLVAFNNTTRALSQLLIDPHNYRPLNTSPRRGSRMFQEW